MNELSIDTALPIQPLAERIDAAIDPANETLIEVMAGDAHKERIVDMKKLIGEKAMLLKVWAHEHSNASATKIAEELARMQLAMIIQSTNLHPQKDLVVTESRIAIYCLAKALDISDFFSKASQSLATSNAALRAL